MKKSLIFICVFMFLFTALFPFNVFPSHADKNVTVSDVYQVVEGILNYEKKNNNESLGVLSDEFLLKAGTTYCDWIAFGLGRLGVEDNYKGYLAVINDYINEKYKNKDKLGKDRATEWHRISLAVLACGGNPRATGSDIDNDGIKDIDLINDGLFNPVIEGRNYIEKQGLNAYVWALILADSGLYKEPENSIITRDILIKTILSMQLDDGGWDYRKKKGDADMTAMVIQAFAPYYNSEKIYKYDRIKNGEKVSCETKVRDAVDEALLLLSEIQTEDGCFTNSSVKNSHSSAQVIIALNSLDIDIFNDSRFIKNGNNVYDGIMSFRTKDTDGGFAHSFSSSGKPVLINNNQVLYSMVSLIRSMKNSRRLYDIREERTESQKNYAVALMNSIDQLDNSSTKEKVHKVYDSYLQIEPSERCYIYNYKKLSSLVSGFNIEYGNEDIEYNEGKDDINAEKEIFTIDDREYVDNIPEKVGTKYKVKVLTLSEKINNSENFDSKDYYKAKLSEYKNKISEIERELKNISKEIREKIYPLDEVNDEKIKLAENLIKRYNELDDFDKKLLNKEDINAVRIMAEKGSNSNITTIVIVSVSAVIVIIAGAIFIGKMLNKRKQKSNKMDESDE